MQQNQTHLLKSDSPQKCFKILFCSFPSNVLFNSVFQLYLLSSGCPCRKVQRHSLTVTKLRRTVCCRKKTGCDTIKTFAQQHIATHNFKQGPNQSSYFATFRQFWFVFTLQFCVRNKDLYLTYLCPDVIIYVGCVSPHLTLIEL